MKMQKLAKEIIGSDGSVILILGVAIATLFGAVAAVELLLFHNAESLFGWISVILSGTMYHFLLLLMIADNNNRIAARELAKSQ